MASSPFSDKIRIRLKAYDYRVLDQSTTEIVETAKRTGARLAGPIPLPTSKNKWTVLRSPHVDKKSRAEAAVTHEQLVPLGGQCLAAVELVVDRQVTGHGRTIRCTVVGR